MVGKGAGTIVNALIGDATVEIWEVLVSFQFIKKLNGGTGCVYNLNFHFALLEGTRDL